MSAETTAKSTDKSISFSTALLQNKVWAFLTLIAIAAALSYALAILTWGITRGYDIMDEGFYLLTAKFPHQNDFPTYFYVWLGAIPRFSVSRVLDFRYTQVISQLFSSLLLAGGYLLALRKLNIVHDRMLSLGAFLFSMIGGLWYFSKVPFSISYNSLTGLFLFAATAFLFDGLPLSKPFCQFDESSSKKEHLKLFAAGLLSGLCFSAKFSSFTVFIVCAFGLIVTISGRAWRGLLWNYFFGVLLSFVFMGIFIFNPVKCWDTLRDFFEYGAAHKTIHNSILTIYWISTVVVVEYFKPYLLPTLVGAFGCFFTLAKTKSTCEQKLWSILANLLYVVLWCVLGFVLIQKNCLHNDYFSGNAFFIIVAVLACAATGFWAGQCGQTNKPFRWRFCVLNLALLILPIVCAVGTGNGLLFQCSLYSAPTFLLLFALSLIINDQLESKIPTFITMGICSTLAVIQFYDGFVRHPYNLTNGLRAQTVASHCDNLRGLKLAPDQAQFFDGTQRILRENGFRSGDQVIAFYNAPGLVYAVDGNSPGLAWYLAYTPYMERNEEALRKIPRQDGKKLFLITGWKINQGIRESMNDAGMQFPNDFKFIGSIHCPHALGTVAALHDTDFMNGKLDMYELVKKSVN